LVVDEERSPSTGLSVSPSLTAISEQQPVSSEIGAQSPAYPLILTTDEQLPSSPSYTPPPVGTSETAPSSPRPASPRDFRLRTDPPVGQLLAEARERRRDTVEREAENTGPSPYNNLQTVSPTPRRPVLPPVTPWRSTAARDPEYIILRGQRVRLPDTLPDALFSNNEE
jgi:hypothetical protein